MTVKTLKYEIPIENANEFKDIIVKFLTGMKLKISKDNRKQNTWDIHHFRINKQLGAIQFGGNERKIFEKNAVSYIELRFDKGHLKTLGIFDDFQSILDCRADTDHFIKFKFNSINPNHIEVVCDDLAKIFKQID